MVRGISILIVTTVATAFAVPAAAQAGDVTYICRVADKPPIVLNLSRNQFHMAGQTGYLVEDDFNMNFTTRLGYRVLLNLSRTPDQLLDERPARVSGTATIGKDGREAAPLRAACVRS